MAGQASQAFPAVIQASQAVVVQAFRVMAVQAFQAFPVTVQAFPAAIQAFPAIPFARAFQLLAAALASFLSGFVPAAFSKTSAGMPEGLCAAAIVA